MRTSALIIPAAVLVFALAGCGGGTPEPGPSSTLADPAPGGTPTDTPVPAAVPVEIIIDVTSGAVLASDEGVYAEFSMRDSATDAVALFTDVFGADPVLSTHPGGLESPPSTTYDWSGFRLIDGDGLTIDGSDYVLDVGTEAVGDVSIMTASGIRVGDPMSAAIAVQDFGGAYDVVFAAVDKIDIDPTTVGESADLGPLPLYTAVYSTGSASGTVAHFTAPTAGWGV